MNMVRGFLAALLLAAAPSAPPAMPVDGTESVVIRTAIPISQGGFALTVHRHTPMDVTDRNGPRSVAATPKSLDALYAALGPLDSYVVRSCRRLMSSTGGISVQFKGTRTPGDLTCGGDARTNALLAAVKELIAQAKIPPAPSRMRVIQ
jgi:hypothetical protein